MMEVQLETDLAMGLPFVMQRNYAYVAERYVFISRHGKNETEKKKEKRWQ